MQQIRDVLVSSAMPINSAEIANAVYGSKKPVSIKTVQNALMNLVQSGKVFEHPPRARGQEKRFWKDSPMAWTAQRLLQTVAAKEKVTLRSAKNSIPSSHRPFFDEALGRLIKEKKIYLLSIGRIKYLLDRRPRPTEHLVGRHFTAIKEILSAVNPYRATRLNVTDVLSLLDGHEDTVRPNLTPVRNIPDNMLSTWYEQDLGTLMGSKSVPIPWTWSRYEKWCHDQSSLPDLQAFKEKLKQLAMDGIIELVPHGMSEPITPEELKIAIRTDSGELLYFLKWLQESSG